MRTIKDAMKVEIALSEADVLSGLVTVTTVAKKLKEMEKAENLQYKMLRSKFYNSLFAHKYQTKEIAGSKWIDIQEPMLTENASLVISFITQED